MAVPEGMAGWLVGWLAACLAGQSIADEQDLFALNPMHVWMDAIIHILVSKNPFWRRPHGIHDK